MKRPIVHNLARALAVLWLAGASCGDVILASDYDQSCAADSDCVAVIVGELCDCLCAMAAINKAELTKYEEAASDRACGTFCSPCGAPKAVACDAGKCVIP
jgi:hypothetical protein